MLASAFSLPVTAAFLRMDTGGAKLTGVPDELFRVRIGPLAAGFLLRSAAAQWRIERFKFGFQATNRGSWRPRMLGNLRCLATHPRRSHRRCGARAGEHPNR
jgi:hypothetical protein